MLPADRRGPARSRPHAEGVPRLAVHGDGSRLRVDASASPVSASSLRIDNREPRRPLRSSTPLLALRGVEISTREPGARALLRYPLITAPGRAPRSTGRRSGSISQAHRSTPTPAHARGLVRDAVVTELRLTLASRIATRCARGGARRLAPQRACTRASPSFETGSLTLVERAPSARASAIPRAALPRNGARRRPALLPRARAGADRSAGRRRTSTATGARRPRAVMRILAAQRGDRSRARGRCCALAPCRRCGRSTRCGATRAPRQPAQHRRALRPRQRLLRGCFSIRRSPTRAASSRRRTRRWRRRRSRSTSACAAGSRVGRGDHVLEIGTGWGGFALHAAGRYGCRVTDHHDLARAVRARARARRRGRARRPRRGAFSRTTATCAAATTSSSRSR